ncbi:uncharacterized protein CCDC197 [Amia ocellicauda]|uniref:uncharacterized protein CCDC197 n=1 Tax=Amia ocellicauda TaxID=2972642 RepID=UPI003463C00F|nr:CCD42 protein [Amia calva]
METLSLPYIKTDDPRLVLKVENRMKNVFVTQLEEPREEEDDNINHIPVIKEASGKLLETGVHTLQKTLVLKKEVEVGEVNRDLAKKRQEFSDRMKALAERRAEFELRQKTTKERALKFDKFLQDNDAKRRRAIKKYQVERKQNEEKEKEMQDLLQQLEKLQARQLRLKMKVAKNKIYEDYLLKIIDRLPENYLEYGTDSLVMPIIRRHETLAITNEVLIKRLAGLSQELEKSQQQLESLHQEHETNKLMTNSELSDLQIQCDRAKERNQQLEINLNRRQGQFRNQSEELGSLLMAVTNLAGLCHVRHYGPLESMDILTMLEMIKEFVLEKTEVERKAARFSDCSSALTSATDQTNAKERGVLQHRTSSKTLLRRMSKTNTKSTVSNVSGQKI